MGQAGLSEPDPGTRAADRALVADDAKLLVVFCSSEHDLPAVLRQINDRSGGVPLIGCSTAGEIAPSREPSVVVTAFGGDGFSIETCAATDAARDPRAAGAQAASCLARVEDRPHRVLMLLTDGLTGDQQEILRGVYGVLGAGVPLVGGCAGDDLKMTRTYQLHGDQVLTDSVVAAGIGSDAPLGIGVRHGWRKIGEPMLVTSSDGGCIRTLDGQPALDMYLERLGASAPKDPSEEEVSRAALVHPLGLIRRDGEEQVRYISGADVVERTLSCMTEIPQGGQVWIMEGDAASVIEATDAACADSLLPLAGNKPLGMLAFDCVSRRSVLDDDGIQVEIDRILQGAAGAPVAGLYTYGEIARTRGVGGFHNQTIVVLSVA
ncbi:FIST signal transduction protein [Pseudonocardia sp. CA-107938]|uniref:FIST signal transduction protein n=1 Tax=Pseudonocardia sp. CA-107938 TaxID=3240021 RepID=UPI003D92D7BC